MISIAKVLSVLLYETNFALLYKHISDKPDHTCPKGFKGDYVKNSRRSIKPTNRDITYVFLHCIGHQV